MNRGVGIEFQYLRQKIIVYLIILASTFHFTLEHGNISKENQFSKNQMSVESCLVRFEVHSNTIIRTGESQAIGGKFLQGFELENPAKCQRLCCETKDCDVYVFEKKNQGYCYLFQCGSTKNFHCKFTRHANYTSALLTQIKVLKTTPEPNFTISHSNMSAQEQELISLKNKPEKNVFVTSSQPKPQESHLSCRRFEFSCHSGECIAIYNACNGIPQCLDGSDEGPECHELVKTDHNNNDSVYWYRFRQFSKTETPILEHKHTLKSKEDTSSLMKNRIGIHENPFDLSFEKTYDQVSDMKNSFPSIAVGKAHISNEIFKYTTRNQEVQMTHRPPFSTLNYPSAKSVEALLSNQEVKSADENLDKDLQVGLGILKNPNVKEINSVFTDISENKSNYEKKNMGDKTFPHPVYTEQYMKLRFIEHYGFSEKPRGAILSFTFGILITLAIVILIGFHLRTVTHKGGRHGGKTSLAPDKDFLVNGMYL